MSDQTPPHWLHCPLWLMGVLYAQWHGCAAGIIAVDTRGAVAVLAVAQGRQP